MISTQEYKKKIIAISSATLTVTTNQLQRRRMNRHHNDASVGFDNVGRKLIASFFFKSETSHTMLTVCVSQSQTFQGSPLVIPRLFVNNVLPSDSLVFRIAATGQVEDLVSLVAAGKASLRDHDTNGDSLLHVSTDNI
jgi:hypothetical protein